ncbi:putative mitochondrial protein [Vitis vinifera]|uniref:Putative mitochondrial protein n=1 Tax=Vitis vinifera TaxID=29760 RepID=A0A438FDS7_VITVI|nr:putative mitochondrial protein [Vitis vinifera]
MVHGLPHLLPTTLVCTDCLNGKQHRDPIPKKSAWRATKKLQLIHANICGPVTPTSNGKRGMYIKCLRTDRGGEFNLEEFNEFCRQCGIKRQLTIAYTPQQNGVADSQKCGDSRDIVFEENRQWEWDTSYEEQVLVDLEWGDDDKNDTEDNEGDENLEAASEGNEEAEGNENQAAANDAGDATATDASDAPAEGSDAMERKVRRAPIWMEDYISGKGLSEGEIELNMALVASTDPINYEEVVMSSKWRLAMDSEINSIEKNQTWKLTDLPTGAKTIGVKWIYKTKLNELGEVDKYKARLVAKGYSQQQGVDFTKIYAPVARMDTVRMIVALTAQEDGRFTSWM